MRLYVKDVNINADKICGRVLNRDVKLFAATTAHRLMFDYIPFVTGTLAESVNIYDEGTAGVIHFTQPYAHRMYKGKDFNFTKDKHPLATAEWDKAAMKTKKQSLIQSIQNYLR